MGQMYEIGLQAGKEVAAKVDALIASLHHGDACGENFDPIKKKVLSDGSTVYKWYQKWNPCLYKDQQSLVDTVRKFNNDNVKEIINNLCDILNVEDYDLDDDLEEKYADYAYKLICVGDEGGSDEYANEYGADYFDCLYDGSELVLPEEFNESDEQHETIDILNELMEQNYDREVSSDELSQLLMDDHITTSYVFENLACEYLHGSKEYREGIDKALYCLLSYNMKDVAKLIKEAVNAAA